MIAKRAPRRKDGKSSFLQLANYLAKRVKKDKEEELIYTKFTNCLSNDYELVLKEIQATQEMNQRTKNDKTYHLIISFAPTDKPTDKEMDEIEQKMCEGLGFGEHQRMSVVHNDTDNLHMHIAINKIHPKTFNIFEPYYDHLKMGDICAVLEKEYNLTQVNHTPDRDRQQDKNIEVQSGIESFQKWVSETIDPDKINTLDSWQSINDYLAESNLELRTRGRGLVIADKDRNLFVKASSINRSLSRQALEKRFGPFNKNSLKTSKKTAKKRYKKAPVHKNSQQRQFLFNEYSAWRSETVIKKRRLLSEITKFAKQQRAMIRDKYQEKRRLNQQRNVRGKHKKAHYSLLKMQRLAELEELKIQLAKQRNNVHKENTLVSWQQFLIAKAEQGDQKALEVLRHHKRKKDTSLDNSIFSYGDKANKPLYKNFQFTINRFGDVTYQLQHGGKFTDNGKLLKMGEVDTKTIEASLRMAQQKFGNMISIKGSDHFKRQAVMVAAEKGLSVVFDDAELETMHQTMKRPGKESNLSDNYINSFIDKRNQTREKVSDILPHRQFKQSDSGTVTYSGQRKLENGQFVALFQKGNNMLVKPISDSEAEQLKSFKLGKKVNIDSKGKVTSRARSR